MLKIKDNVDLKVLEKYGFYDNGYGFANRQYTYISRCGSHINKLFIHKDRHLMFNNATLKVYDVLYDLIKADLVEKIGE